MTPRSLIAALLVLAAPALVRADSLVIDFSDLSLPTESFWNGPDPNGTIVDGTWGPVNVGSFTSGGATFVNRYDLTFGSWGGFAYSNTTDTTTPGFTNQFSAITGGDASGDGIYAVAYGQSPSTVRFDLPELSPLKVVTGMSAQFTNTTYTALDLEFGGAFGPAIAAGDYFLMTVFGYSDLGGSGSVLGAVDFYLADYRDGASLIVRDWTEVDLSSLIGARSLGFRLVSTVTGEYGVSTPYYFAMDDFTIRYAVIPEPASLAMTALGLIGFGLVLRRRRQPA